MSPKARIGGFTVDSNFEFKFHWNLAGFEVSQSQLIPVTVTVNPLKTVICFSKINRFLESTILTLLLPPPHIYIMPKESERKNLLEKTLSVAIAASMMDLLFEDDSSDDEIFDNMMCEDEISDEIDDDNEIWNDNEEYMHNDSSESFLDLGNAALAIHGAISQHRYLGRQGNKPMHNYYLVNANPMDMNEDDWRQEARMSRESFKIIRDMIKDDEVFQNNSNVDQAPIEVQLLVALYRFGMNGNAASTGQIAQKFKISKGSTELYVDRVIVALNRLRNHTIQWPSAEERREIGKDIGDEYAFPQCVGFVDGTTIDLAFKPSNDGEDYFSRKMRYSLAAMVVCDDECKIRFADCGFAGSAHDSRVYRSTPLAQTPEKFFSHGEYLLGDKGYPLTRHLITPYKGIQADMPENVTFNDALSHVRVKIEHTFGRLKSRFQSLDGMRIFVNRRKGHYRAVLWFFACAVLHNLLIDDNLYEIDEEELRRRMNLNGDESSFTEDTSSGNAKRELLKSYILEQL